MKKLLLALIALFVISTVTVEAQYMGWGNRYNGGRSSHTSYYTNNYVGYPTYYSDQSYNNGYRYTTYYNRDPVTYPYSRSYGAYSTYRGSPYAGQVYAGGNYYRRPRAYDSYYSNRPRIAYQSPSYVPFMMNSFMPGLD